MKLFAVALLAACVPALCHAVVATMWEFAQFPENGTRDIAFKYNITQTPQTNDYAFLNYVGFHNVREVSAIVIMPREKSRGRDVLRAAFITTCPDASTTHPHCNQVVLEDAVVTSCVINVLIDYRHIFSLVVENIGGTAWRGKLADAAGGRVIIGDIKLPSDSGLIVNGGYSSFQRVQDLLHICSLMPLTTFQIYNPTSVTRGATGGQITMMYEDEDCVQQQQFNVTALPQSYNITLGFDY